MSDYIDSLEQALRDAGVHEYRTVRSDRARRHTAQAGSDHWQVASATSPRRLRRRWSPLAIVVAVLLVGGSAAGAIAAILDTGSAPLTGAVPGITAQLLRYDIPITPDLEPGDAGWCSSPIFSIRNGVTDAAGGDTCSPAAPAGAPVILGGGEPISNERDFLRQAGRTLNAHQGQLNLFWMVVSSQVAAVRLRPGEVVTSRADPRLPAGWRAVVAFVRGVSPTFPQPVALDRAGRPIIQRDTALSRVSPGGAAAATRAYDPGGTAPSPCAIHAAHLPSVTAQWEVVATKAPALGSAVAPNALFSCARSWFSIKGQSQAPSAAILLNAQDPRRPAARPPGLTPTDQPGIFSNPSAELVGKRIGQAWLVVQDGSVTQSKMLLSTLRVGGSSLPSPANRR